MKRFIAAGIFVSLSVVIGSPDLVSARTDRSESVDQQPATDAPWMKNFKACVESHKETAVLFLLDQSRSLRETTRSKGSDPTGVRVEGVKASILALESLSQEVSPDGSNVTVYVAIDGFGERYYADGSRDGFLRLTPESEEYLNAQAESYRSKNNDIFTDYRAALFGAGKAFERYRNTREIQPDNACQLLVWFTDGEYDTDDKYGQSKDEKEEIRNTICNPGGAVDLLRASRVYTYAIGLGIFDERRNKAPDYTLLRRISEGQGEPCGSVAPIGQLNEVSDLDSLPDIFLQPPIWDSSEQKVSNCDDGSSDCSELRFNVGSWVTDFKMLVKSPNRDLKVSIELPGANPLDLPISSQIGAESRDKPLSLAEGVSVRPLSRSRALLISELDDLDPSVWVGQWTVRFEGRGASEGRASLSFLGELAVNSPISELDRENISGLQLNLVSTGKVPSDLNVADFSSVTSLVKFGEGGAGLEFRDRRSDESNQIVFSKAEMQQVLQSQQAREWGALTVTVTPVGVVSFPESLKPILVEMPASTVRIKLRTGDGFPFVEGAALETISGGRSGVIKLTVVGPKEGEGRVSVEEFNSRDGEGPVGLTVAKTICLIAANETATCDVPITATGTANYTTRLDLALTIGGSKVNGGRELEDSVEVKVVMTRPLDTGKLKSRLLLLLVTFLLIQLGLQVIQALLLARFKGVDSTSRIVPIPVRISDDGRLEGRQGGSVRAEMDAAAFAFDLASSFRDREFEVSGVGRISLSVSVIRAMFRFPSHGDVSSNGHCVAAGGTVNRKGQTLTIGRIPLSLRNQWILVANENVTENHEAVLVLLLDPITPDSFERQITEILEKIEDGEMIHRLLGEPLVARDKAKSMDMSIEVGEPMAPTEVVKGTWVTPDEDDWRN